MLVLKKKTISFNGKQGIKTFCIKSVPINFFKRYVSSCLAIDDVVKEIEENPKDYGKNEMKLIGFSLEH